MYNMHSFTVKDPLWKGWLVEMLTYACCCPLSEVRHVLSQTCNICLPILDMKKWWITISVGWTIRIFFEVETGIVSQSDWLWGSPNFLFERYLGFFCLSKVNLNRYLMTYLCSDLGLYRTDFWSLLCLYVIVLRWATLHHLIAMSYDISSWESFIISLYQLIWNACQQTLHKKRNNTINNNQRQ
jgi:hypothetical protein